MLLTALAAHTQDNTIRIGVAVMQNEAGRSGSGALERDRLVQALNQQKPDKKTHIQVQGVPLDATNGNEAEDEAASKKCALWFSQSSMIRISACPTPLKRIPIRNGAC